MTRLLRRVHVVLGVLLSPTLLFFALTGGVQALGWHEQKASPPPWLEHVAQVHKHQTWTLRARRPPPPAAAPGTTTAPREEPKPRPGQAWLKGFVVFASVGLAVSTLLGLWMAFLPARDRVVNAILLAAGTIVPIAFVAW